MADKKEEIKNAVEDEELDIDDLEDASGGTNPFSNYKSQDNNKIDDDLKNKI